MPSFSSQSILVKGQKWEEKKEWEEIKFRNIDHKPLDCPKVPVLLIIKPRWRLKERAFENWIRACAFTITGEALVDIEQSKTYNLSFLMRKGGSIREIFRS